MKYMFYTIYSVSIILFIFAMCYWFSPWFALLLLVLPMPRE